MNGHVKDVLRLGSCLVIFYLIDEFSWHHTDMDRITNLILAVGLVILSAIREEKP